MKKLILLFVIVAGLSTGCGQGHSTSNKPTFFVVNKKTQNTQEKESNVAKYRLEVWVTTGKEIKYTIKWRWFTLQEGFQVGDTLKLTK
jgi:hypothetical protein